LYVGFFTARRNILFERFKKQIPSCENHKEKFSTENFSVENGIKTIFDGKKQLKTFFSPYKNHKENNFFEDIIMFMS